MIEIESEGSISSIIKEIKSNLNSYDIRKTWFRGQPDYSFKLIPSIFRLNVRKNSSTQDLDVVEIYSEAEMYAEFVRRYPEHSNNHKNVFEWLTLMQHYRLPTRLLDWSTNLLVALYFCCKEKPDTDGSIFAFKPFPDLMPAYDFNDFLSIQVTSVDKSVFYEKLIRLADMKFGEETTINGTAVREFKNDIVVKVNNDKEKFSSFRPKIVSKFIYSEGFSEIISQFSKVYIYKPPHLNPRIRQQHGCFTFHGGKYFEGRDFIKVFEMENEDCPSEICPIKVRVKHTDKEKLLYELAVSGISEATLFPEMEYQVEDIKNIYKNSYKLLSDTNCLY